MGFLDKIFTPKYKSGDYYDRMEIAHTTNNQEILRYLAKYDEKSSIRWEAIHRISDIETLKYVALKDKSADNRSCALRNMNYKDLELLSKEDITPALKKEIDVVQGQKKADEWRVQHYKDEANRNRDTREKENKKEGHQCPHCHSYNLSVRSDAGIHCWDCGKDSLHYL